MLLESGFFEPNLGCERVSTGSAYALTSEIESIAIFVFKATRTFGIDHQLSKNIHNRCML